MYMHRYCTNIILRHSLLILYIWFNEEQTEVTETCLYIKHRYNHSYRNTDSILVSIYIKSINRRYRTGTSPAVNSGRLSEEHEVQGGPVVKEMSQVQVPDLPLCHRANKIHLLKSALENITFLACMEDNP